MSAHVAEVTPNDPLWPVVSELFPRAVGWLADPNDDGDYHFLAAADERGTFLGGGVIDVGAMSFGPLADRTIGFLENIEVLEPHRRRGVGTALLRAALDLAWTLGAQSVRWTADYDNAAAIALYDRIGATFVPEEDPDAADPQHCYTVVVANPARGV